MLGLDFSADGPQTHGLISEHFRHSESGISIKLADVAVEILKTQDRSVVTVRIFRPEPCSDGPTSFTNKRPRSIIKRSKTAFKRIQWQQTLKKSLPLSGSARACPSRATLRESRREHWVAQAHSKTADRTDHHPVAGPARWISPVSLSADTFGYPLLDLNAFRRSSHLPDAH